LQRHPLATKTLTSALLFGLGDFMSQKLEGASTLDTARLARMTAWGAIFTPFAHAWYGALDKMIPGSGMSVVAAKVAADQVRHAQLPCLACLPAFTPPHISLTSSPRLCPPPPPQLTWTVAINCGFFWTTTFMETGSSSAGIAKIQDKLWPTLKVNWVVWPVLQGISFSVIPLQYRILYINFCSLFWSAYLSNVNAAAPSPAAAAASSPPALR